MRLTISVRQIFYAIAAIGCIIAGLVIFAADMPSEALFPEYEMFWNLLANGIGIYFIAKGIFFLGYSLPE